MSGDFTQRFIIFQKDTGLRGKDLAKRLDVSPSYITDIRGGRIKEGGLKFWDGVREKYPGWESFLRGHVSEPPDSSLQSSPDVESLGDRRIFNKKARLTDDEAMLLAEWFAQDQEAKDLVVGLAECHIDGSFSESIEARFVDFQIRALARSLLQKIKEEVKKKIPGG